VERTAAWAARAKAARTRLDDQSLFGIVQGGTDPDLRRESAERTVAVGFDGYGIGGLSVGEPRHEMLPALEAAIAALPADRPRYLMGVGDPIGLVEGIARGVDLFDCVLPTRIARHGSVLTGTGRLQIRNAAFARDAGPLDPTCGCAVCARWSRAYVRHLLQVGEPTALRLLTWHNLAWTLALIERTRAAISDGTLDSVRREVAEAYE
jgi:queuine tRNA-ribosyltransferase